MSREGLLAFTLAALSVGCGGEPMPGALRDENLLFRLTEEYVSERLRFYPVEATASGHHAYDRELGSYTREAMGARLMWLQDFRQKLLGVELTGLPPSAYVDGLWLTSMVKAEVFDLSEVARWRKAPGYYGDIIRSGLLSLLHPGSLSEAEIDSLFSRLRQVPALLDAARANLESPPELLVNEGLDDLAECRRLVENLPADLGKDLAPREIALLGQHSREAARAIQGFIDHLQTQRGSGSPNPFAIGAEKLRRLLLYHEMVDMPLDTLRLKAEQAHRKARREFEGIASRLEPSGTPISALQAASRARAPATEIISLTERILGEVRRFAVERDLFGTPPESEIRIADAPPVLDLEGPMTLFETGPLEDRAADAWFLLALPQPDWPPEQQEARLRLMNTRALELSVIREIYPGNHLHHSSRAASPSRIRKLLASRANRQGWALYAEQMLLDEGFRWDDPLLRLMQLHHALAEQCRLLAALRLHAEGMSLAAAVELFRDGAYLDQDRAQREARAVAADPTLLSPALGWLLILDLRDDFLRSGGPDRSLGRFHDRFLSASALPLRLVRLVLMPEEP